VSEIFGIPTRRLLSIFLGNRKSQKAGSPLFSLGSEIPVMRAGAHPDPTGIWLGGYLGTSGIP